MTEARVLINMGGCIQTVQKFNVDS